MTIGYYDDETALKEPYQYMFQKVSEKALGKESVQLAVVSFPGHPHLHVSFPGHPHHHVQSMQERLGNKAVVAAAAMEPQPRSQTLPLWNVNIEVVQAERAWYSSQVSCVQGREGVEMYPKTQNRKKSQGIRIVGDLLHIFSHWGANIIHIERKVC